MKLKKGIPNYFSALIIYMAFALLQLSCTNQDNQTEVAAAPPGTSVIQLSPESTETIGLEINEAIVDSVEILLIGGKPPFEAIVTARGNLPDGCTLIDKIDLQESGNAFTVAITTAREGEACTEALVPYEEQIALNIADRESGTYSVSVNGVIQSFVLSIDNVAAAPTEAPSPTQVSTQDVSSAETPSSPSTISGMLFHDLCAIAGGEGGEPAIPSEGCIQLADGALQANGLFSADEPPLVGITVTLAEGNCDNPGTSQSTATAADGTFSFSDLPQRNYCLQIDTKSEPNASQLIPGRWTTIPSSGTLAVTVNGDTTLDPIGWDYQFLPVPTIAQTTDPSRAACIDLFAFDGDVTIQDDAPFEPGEPVVKIWRLINTGSCAWNSNYALTFLRGDRMGAPSSVAIEGEVAPGDSVDVRVEMIAPDAQGTYRGDWIMRSDFDQIFGVGGDIERPVWLQIAVVEPDTVGSIRGLMWSDNCDQSAYTYGDPTLPVGCLQNANGTIRGDGLYDPASENPISGVTILLGNGACGESEQFRFFITGEDGSYEFPNLLEGTYCVFIEVLDAANYSTLIPGNFTVPQPGRSGISVTLAPDADFDNINFAWDKLED